MLNNLKPIYTTDNTIKNMRGINHSLNKCDWWDFLKKYPIGVQHDDKEVTTNVDIRDYLKYQKIYFIHPYLY